MTRAHIQIGFMSKANIPPTPIPSFTHCVTLHYTPNSSFYLQLESLVSHAERKGAVVLLLYITTLSQLDGTQVNATQKVKELSFSREVHL